MSTATDILKRYWGYSQFRPLQEDIVDAVLSGHDVLALLPTGGGKSICFQVPAMAREGVCLVVSPLIALMKDQVEQLKKRGIPAAAIYSGQSRREIDIVLDNAVHGGLKFLYVSPERLLTDLFQVRVQKMKVALLAIDEAHCISQWGYDFRPPYLQIAELRTLLPTVNVIALTATATKEVKVDIQEKLAFKNGLVFQKSFSRANLSYSVRMEEDKERKLLNVLQKVPGTAVVYVRSRKRTKEIAQLLVSHKISADFYHAGLPNDQRSKKQDAWINNRIRVIVATNAFGMGIDKPDVRLVVHMDLPDTLEAYYQEAGRGGRDEKKAYAVILYNQSDIEDLRKRMEQSHPPVEYIKKVYQGLANYYKIAVGSSRMESYNFDIDDFCKQFQLHTFEAFHAIKKLQDEGFVHLNESYYQPSQLVFTISPQQLYQFQIANAKFDALFQVLLRTHGGELFNNFVKINEAQVAGMANKSVDELKQELEFLSKSDVLEYQAQKDSPQITFITARFDANKLPLDKASIEAKALKAHNKAEQVIKYTEHQHRCRTQLLLEYFDEISYQACEVCDICLEKKKEGRLQFSVSQVLKLKHLLNDRAYILIDLVQALEMPETEALSLIRQLLESGELAYDQSGKIYLV